ncbi:50S ribosomal protein L23 [Candidatus Dependentiae bacterium]
MALRISIYDVILGPIMTDKAYKLNRKFQKLVLKVHPHSNKPLVKEAIERLFEVKVKNVRMLIRKGKLHRLKGGQTTQKSSMKKAIVTLKEGYKVDIWDQPGVTVIPSESSDKSLKGDKPVKGESSK